MILRLKEHPHLLVFDSTYKVNKYNMPLFQGNGITQYNTNFSTCFALISDEKEESFVWILASFKTMLEQHQIELPHVVISDFDRSFKNAISEVSGAKTKQHLCKWHIMKNVVYHIKKKWLGLLEGTHIGEQGGGQGSRLKIRYVEHLTAR